MKSSLFVGKTIKSVDTRACNEWIFHFTDGSQAVIEVEAVYPSIGLYGLKVRESEEA